MEAVVANVDNVKFDIEVALEQQLGAQPLPFIGMDKSTSAICVFFIEGSCIKGTQCPFRHVRGDRTVVCKHWLRGLCKKGDQCEFLHEYDMTKMPECYFYTRFNACHNKECPFLHIDPESKVRPCPWYDRGFCRHGPHCRHRHVRKVLCLNYLAGFCPDGPNCKFIHATFELPQIDETAKIARKAGIICHVCGEMGHKSYQCPKNADLENTFPANPRDNPKGEEESGEYRTPNEHPPGHVVPRRPADGRPGAYMNSGEHAPGNFPQYQPYQFHPRPPYYPRGHRDRDRERDDQPRRALEDVVCYKCGYKGHYANKCSKGHLAFLSHKAGPNNREGGRT